MLLFVVGWTIGLAFTFFYLLLIDWWMAEWMDGKTDKQMDRPTDGEMDWSTNGEVERVSNQQTIRQTDGQTEKGSGRQTDRQTDILILGLDDIASWQDNSISTFNSTMIILTLNPSSDFETIWPWILRSLCAQRVPTQIKLWPLHEEKYTMFYWDNMKVGIVPSWAQI